MAGVADSEILVPWGSLDHPPHGAVVRGDVLAVQGWCLFAGTSVATVEVFLNGASAGLARPYVDRHDLVRAYPDRDAVVSGFEASISLDRRELQADSTVSVVVTALDGTRWSSPVHDLVIERVVVDRTGEARAALLRSRSSSMLDTIPSARDGVLVLTHDLSYGGGQLWLHELLRQLNGFPGIRCQVVSIADGPLREHLEEMGIEVGVTAGWRLDSVDAYEGRVHELALLMRASGAGAVLVNTLGLFPAIDAAHRAGVPSVWAIHESFEPAVFRQIVAGHFGEHPHVKARFEATLGLPRALVFEAPQTAALFAHLSKPEQRFVVDYGVDIAEIDAYRSTFDREGIRQSHGFAVDDTVLVVVGVFEGRKAQAAIVAAFDELAEVHPRLHLVLVGAHGNPYTAGVRHQVGLARHGDRIRISPVGAEIYHWYAMCDFLVCASDIESLPRSILEAMAFELPIVSTDAFGIADLIEDGSTGWLTRPRDVQGLVGLLHLVLRLPEADRRAVARRARVEVERRSGERSYGLAFARALSALLHDPQAELASALSASPDERPSPA